MDKVKENKGRPKNKFRQVLLVEGRPTPLYRDNVRTKVSVTVDGVTHRLGYMSVTMINLLNRIPGATVETVSVNLPKTVSLKTVRGLHIRKAKENTTIEVSAPTKEALADKIKCVVDELSDSGSEITERCSWVCTTDKQHPELYPTDKPQELPAALPSEEPIDKVETPADDVPTPSKPPQKKTSPGRHGPGKPPVKRESTQAAKQKIKSLRELVIKKGLVGAVPNSQSTDLEMHGE